MTTQHDSVGQSPHGVCIESPHGVLDGEDDAQVATAIYVCGTPFSGQYVMVQELLSQSWQSVGNWPAGINGLASQLTVYNGDLYLGGNFGGGLPNVPVLQHNSSTGDWVDTGWPSPTQQPHVLRLGVVDGELFAQAGSTGAGGDFWNIPWLYDGASWSRVTQFVPPEPPPPGGRIGQVAALNGALYMGASGMFDTAAVGLPAQIAKLAPGASAWVPAGPSFYIGGRHVIPSSDNGLLYFGGVQSVSDTLFSVIRFDGGSWSPVGPPVFPSQPTGVLEYQGELLAWGGDNRGVWRYTGITWEKHPALTIFAARDMVVVDDWLYMIDVSGVPTNIRRWDGTTLELLPTWPGLAPINFAVGGIEGS